MHFTASLPDAETAPAPRLDCWLPPEPQRNGIGLIIFPGGGYGGLAGHEGKGYAEFFVQHGVCCFVVTYRLGSQGFRHPAMLEDAQAAVHTVRQRAAEFGVSAGRIGVMGSSAGGHLAAHTMVSGGRRPAPVSVRPDFGVLCYPVITMLDPFTHAGTRANLLGGEATETAWRAVSPELLATRETPPAFLWHTWDDGAVPVENSLLFASALRRHGVPFELHIYPAGHHGLGLNTEYPWGRDCVRWMLQGR
ncbi:MAG: Acetylxylan esterase precursor [Lentisphaerae bacterium ADurb.BinA184]|nr:MAG: Acetylxylan esterase precursor [Lentisphaerae bacterium ADurb.BinA184]